LFKGATHYAFFIVVSVFSGRLKREENKRAFFENDPDMGYAPFPLVVLLQ
jgi:hypothetical protein